MQIETPAETETEAVSSIPPRKKAKVATAVIAIPKIPEIPESEMPALLTVPASDGAAPGRSTDTSGAEALAAGSAGPTASPEPRAEGNADDASAADAADTEEKPE